MIGKATRNLISVQKNKFSTFRTAVMDLLNRDDVQSPYFQTATYNPTLPLQGHSPKFVEDQQVNHQVTTLSNGVRVMTESQGVPSNVHLGLLVNMGTRDETNETSGSLLSIKNTYLKTVLNTNETVNYGMVQMSGGQFSMDYNQETSYFKAHCLEHDVVDILKMMTDCALEPRSVVAANVGINKNANSHKLAAKLNNGEDMNNEIFRTAYGLKGLGMPLLGLKGNVDNLNSNVLQAFQLQNIRPQDITVSASGVQVHEEFVELVNQKLSQLLPESQPARERQASQYQGGEVRTLSDGNTLNLALCFESCNWTHSDFYALRVAQTLLGNSSRTSSRAFKNLVNKNHYVDSVNAVNSTFSDSGLFGVQVSGSASHGNDLLQGASSELKALTQKISEQELAMAKALLKTDLLFALEKQEDRLEEATRNINSFGKVVLNEYVANIDKVTGEQVNKAVAAVLATNPTLVAFGGEANRLVGYDKVSNLVRL